MNKVWIATLCRMESSRLPGKVCMDLGGKPMFVQVFERCQAVLPDIQQFLLTTYLTVDDGLAFLAKAYGYDVFRGQVKMFWGRVNEFLDYVDAKPDDILIILSGDQPFRFCKYLPFAIQQLQETGADIFLSDAPVHTLGWAIGSPAGHGHDFSVRAIRKYWESQKGYIIVQEDAMWLDWYDFRYVICKMPSWYYDEWPWMKLSLDYPVQALKIKWIYDLLYRGEPIDVRDVYDLHLEREYLAHLGDGVEILASTRAAYPYGTTVHHYDIKDFRKLGLVAKEVEWRG